MQICVLGPIEVRSATGAVEAPAGGKQRRLLAVLLASAPRSVSTDRLIDLLWEEDLPSDPPAALRNQVARLRAFLAAAAAGRLTVRTEPAGYRVEVEPDALDAGRFESIHGRAAEAGRPELRLALLEEAIALWRGEPYGELADLPEVAGEASRLRELRLGVEAERVECLVRLGRLSEALAALEPLVRAEPLRERSRSLRMQALYLAGRHSEALAEYEAFRLLLDEELGLDPSPALRAIKGAVLRHEPLPLGGAAAPAATLPEEPGGERLRQVIRLCRARDGVRLAYATVGRGPPLVKAANWLNHLEFDWESPVWRRLFRDLASERTLVRYDERGSGLSDRDPDRMALDDWVLDLESVVDACGLERFPLLGISQGCAVCVEYAARHPERVTGLILHGGYAAGWRAARDYSAAEVARREASIDIVRHGWGEDTPAYRQMFTLTFIPGGTPEEIAWFNELERRTVSPEGAARFMEAFAEIDVRPRLAEVRAPTLVLHGRLDQRIHPDQGRALAAGIPGARFVLLESANHLILEHEPAYEPWMREVRRFLADEVSD